MTVLCLGADLKGGGKRREAGQGQGPLLPVGPLVVSLWGTQHQRCPRLPPGSETVPPVCPPGLRTVGAHGRIISRFLKNCLVIKKIVIVKNIWYKTGSQWPGDFSCLGTRTENVQSAPSGSRPVNDWWGVACSRPRPWGPPCVLQLSLQGQSSEGVSHIQAGSGGETGGNVRSPGALFYAPPSCEAIPEHV